ncbi:class I SAM-dependent methyltransferase [Aridibaculum aurantiacum]|uniref:class I SAM-dependent methyltransferase n=1 Tax=Aridibaculum aurantiacum TaxID=2810307 RepID=UPI001A96AF80|nr:class I SAM-dependent methyltransferase [Aridibaculum aurantiacum]
MPDHNWFKDWFNSPYYHLLYKHRDDEEALSFIRALIKQLNPAPGSKILDVACGKGRHSKVLAELGYDVTGIDLSLESIEEAKTFETDTLHFFQHDMRLPFWINYFDYAFNFFTSFGYFRTLREHENAIRTIAQSMHSQGVFVMDYLNVHYAEDRLEKTHEKEIDGVVFRISRWHNDEHFFKQIQVSENGVIKHLFTEKVAKFSLGDFTDMFAYQGMQIQEVFGDYHFEHYDVRKSPRLIMVAKKIRDV